VEIVRRASGLVAISILWGCTATEALLGHPRAPISPDQVRIYLAAPAQYDKIAILESSSEFSFALTPDGKTEAVIQRMKSAAAKLGANGILLQGVSDAQTGSIGTGVGSSSYGPHSSVGGSVGGSFALTSKVTQGLAIYVPEDQGAPAAAPFPLMAPPPPPPPGTAAPAPPPH
jgi:hypothetical protein